jgi:hypothetical protein
MVNELSGATGALRFSALTVQEAPAAGWTGGASWAPAGSAAHSNVLHMNTFANARARIATCRVSG